MHPHVLGDCPECSFEGNAIEYSHQRAINVHGTHRMTVTNNVMTDVRGAAIYVEDGNEMWNDFLYNVAICPWRLNDPYKRGCTIPGSPNGQADTALNQVGIWLSGAVNNMIGNRMANSFNGMLVDVAHAGSGLGPAKGLTCISGERVGRWEGNTFHSHGRFGTYALGNFFPKRRVGELQQVSMGGHFPTSIERNDVCGNGASDFDQEGKDAGWSHAIKSNFDWRNTFVGHYGSGDIQYNSHVSIENNNLIYWKTSKSFADGCSALFKDGYYSKGNMALPDEGTFLFEDTVIDGPVTMEANHHCGVGTTGVLCQPHYVFVNTRRVWNSKGNWLYFQGGDKASSTAHGGIFTLSPPDCLANLRRTNVEAKSVGSLLPGGFCSVVNNRYTYLAATNLCDVASSLHGNGMIGAEMSTRYDKGILCRAPLRALKIFSHGLRASSAKKLRVEMWLDASDVATQNSKAADHVMDVPIHLIGDHGDDEKDDAKPPRIKQGYSLPVIPMTPNVLDTHSYRISLGTNLSPVPKDWIIEFSDPVFGHRWSEEKIRLNVVGRQCGTQSDMIVSSQHDRKYLVSDDGGLERALHPTGKGRGRGACTSHPRMLDIDCDAVHLKETNCPSECPDGCNDAQYCACGTAKCVCRPGYAGDQCEIDLCGAARCSSHGACAARFLGGDLPVSQSACICEPPWTGPLCDQNLCAPDSPLHKTCSGKGTCVHSGGNDTRCDCNQGYSGMNCETSCDGKCGGGGGVFPFGCAATADANTFALQCGPTGGCFYPQSASTVSKTWCSYFSRANEQNSGVPECSSENDCRLAPKYDCVQGKCGAGIPLQEGTPCNSKPWGICHEGECLTKTDGSGSGSSTSSSPAPVPRTGDDSSNTDGSSNTEDSSSDGITPSSYSATNQDVKNQLADKEQSQLFIIVGVLTSVVLLLATCSLVLFLRRRSVARLQHCSSLASRSKDAWSSEDAWSSSSSEWRTHTDPASGQEYFEHKISGKTSWTDPRKKTADIELVSVSNPLRVREV